MAGFTYSEIDSEVDPLDQINFRLYIPEIPGNNGDSTSLTLNIQNLVWPGSSTEDYEVTRFGYTKSYRGRRIFPRTLSISFLEVTGAPNTKALKGWLEFKAGSETNTSEGFSDAYKVTAYLEVLDTTGQVTHSVDIIGLMVQDVPDTTLDGSASAQVLLQASFKYDRVEESGIAVR